MIIQAIPLVRSAKALEFGRAPIGVERNGVGEANCLLTPVDSIASSVELIVINGETQQVEPFVAGALAQAIKTTHEIQSRQMRVDCSAFAVMLCGGFYRGVPKGEYDICAKAIDYRKPTINSRHFSVARVMEPLQLAEPFLLKGRGTVFWPQHTVVPVSEGRNLYAHKFGEGPVALTDLETATWHYGTNLLASIIRMEFADHIGRAVLTYGAPASDGHAPAETYRFNTR